MLDAARHVIRTASERALTSLVVWGWAAPFLVFGLVFTELSAISSVVDLLLVIGVGVASHLALGLVVWFAGLTVFSPARRNSAAPWIPVVVMAVAGSVRGGVLAIVFSAVDAGDEVAWWVRVITSAAMVTVSFFFAAYSVELWWRYRERRDELLRQLGTTRPGDTGTDLARDAYRDLIEGGMGTGIRQAKKHTLDTLDRLAQELDAGQLDVDRAATALSDSDQAWREVGESTISRSPAPVPGLTARELAHTLLGIKPVAQLVFVFVAAFSYTRVVGPEIGWVEALGPVGVVLAAQLLVGLSMNSAHRAGAPWNQMVFGAGVAILVVVPVVVGVARELPLAVQVVTAWLGLVAALLALAVGLPIALSRRGDAVLDDITARVDGHVLENIRQQADMFALADRVGAYLRGPLRGEFLQLSMDLRDALTRGDRARATTTLEQLRQVASGISVESQPFIDLPDVLRSWRSHVQLDTNIDAVHIPERIRGRVTSVVTEAVNSAIRHGSTSRVGVFFSYRAEGLQIEIEGAIVTTTPEGDGGLDAAVLDHLAAGTWFYEVTPDGRHRLVVTLKTLG